MNLRALAVLLSGVLFPTLAVGEPRLALVIGNSNYGPDIGQLANPVNDADLIGNALQRQGFSVVVVKNVDQKTMQRAISEFGRRLISAGPAPTALFYYAGHGLQVSGANYLVPLNAKIENESDVQFEAVEADSVLRTIEFGGSRVSIIVLDACRNNPLARNLRSTTRGLARIEAPQGSFVAYSTAPGQTAVDGTGRNSPFAAALAEEVQRPGAAIEETFRNVRAKVIAATNNAQIPWDSSSLTTPFYFSEPQTISTSPTPAPQSALSPTAASSNEALFWESIEGSKRVLDFEAYLKKYPNGDFVDLARIRAEELKTPAPVIQQQPAVQTAAPTPPVDSLSIETAYWNKIKDSRRTADFEAYLDKFPGGKFTDQTLARLDALRKAASPIVPTPAAPSAAAPSPASPAQSKVQFESPLPDGTIVLSPGVAVMLNSYLQSGIPESGVNYYFYVSLDGQFATGAIGERNGESAINKNAQVKQKASSDCEAHAKTECVLLFSISGQKRAYRVYSQ